MGQLRDSDLSQDYYKLMGVDPQAPAAIIRSAYRTMMSELGAHPDRGGGNDRAVALNRAKEILLDPLLRAEYDRHRTESRSRNFQSPRPSRAPADDRESRDRPAAAAGDHELRGGALWFALGVVGVVIVVVWFLFILDIRS